MLVASFAVASTLHAARPAPEASYAFVASDTKLWTEPGRFGEPKAMLKTGVELNVLEYSSNRDWVRVQTASGRDGWIPTRFTTQDGRRTFPINAKLGSDGQVSSRAPASARAPASVELSAPNADADSSKSWEGLLGFEYMNQITREKTSGFGLDASALHRLTNSWSLGPALEWNRFSKTASEGGYTTSRKSHRIFPHLLFRYRWADFRADLGLGCAMDRTTLRTEDATHNVITTTPDGLLATGSDGTDYSVGFRITPRYILPVSRLVKVGFYLSYMLDVSVSKAEGDFAGAEEAIDSPYSYLGGGMSASLDF